MAKKTAAPPTPGHPQVSPVQGVELLLRQIASGEALKNAPSLPEDDYDSWEMLTRNFLEKAFGVNSPNVSSITDVGKYGAFPMGADDSYWEGHRRESLTTQLVKLRGLVELLRTESQLQDTGVSAAGKMPSPTGHRVFLVHGHDEAALHETARFLSKLEQSVLILREQPNKGQTIVEKFEEYSDVGFAVVLLTPDDRGSTVANPDQVRPRARQNVIFELGYFIGRLGRNRVCALYRQGVEIPSDYAGVLYVEMDDRGGWKLELAKELKAANLPVDMNKAL
ncbi:MAG TPA: nucleotide-binding protein [Polyangia bacterium]|nr:nucleotide-binding protein [Polyangia bacterium]